MRLRRHGVRDQTHEHRGDRATAGEDGYDYASSQSHTVTVPLSVHRKSAGGTILDTRRPPISTPDRPSASGTRRVVKDA